MTTHPTSSSNPLRRTLARLARLLILAAPLGYAVVETAGVHHP